MPTEPIDPVEERERKLAAQVERKTPKRCPKCGGANLSYAVEWFAHSLDPCDIMNAAVLSEHQCHDCAISFWM